MIHHVDVEGTLQAAIQRHKSNPNAKSSGVVWYESEEFTPENRKQIQLGIEALLYAGCMAAARRTFDTVVRQNLANAAMQGDDANDDNESDAEDGRRGYCRRFAFECARSEREQNQRG